MDTDYKDLRIAFYEILQGFSRAKWENRDIFIKHFSSREHAFLDAYYRDFSEDAKKQGLPTLAEKLANLEKTGIWTAEDEDKIDAQEKSLTSLRSTKNALFIPSQRRQMDDQIKAAQNALEASQIKKYSYIGTTVESYTNKKINDLTTFHSLFADQALKTRLFSETEFDELDSEEVDAIYDRYIRKFDEKLLKKIAMSAFFQNMFSLCDGNAMQFYGKAIVNLSFYETELLLLGGYYKQILSKGVPEHIMKQGDPDLLENWAVGNKGLKAAMAKFESGDVAIAGMTKEDMQTLGIKAHHQKDDVTKALKERGGMSMMEYLKQTGEI